VSGELTEEIKGLSNPKSVRFSRAANGTSASRAIRAAHYIFKMPWQDNPWINLQAAGKMANFAHVPPRIVPGSSDTG
jgi:hypothetical protein